MMNKMRDIRIEKIVLNIGLGSSGNIENAMKILKEITGMKPVITRTHRRNTFGVAKGKPIGCKVTIRKNTNEMLKRLLMAKENILKEENFDKNGNFAFGVHEYIDVPGVEYDPQVGIIGFDVCVTLERPGYCIKRKKPLKKIGRSHLITKEEAIKFVKENFGVKIS
jgi:large subunit ribosomal protein L5